ncbi:MAG: hypothetical protein AABX47_08290 [Nanoarchaeota archaeon]
MSKKNARRVDPRSIYARKTLLGRQIFKLGSVDIPFNYLFVMLAGGAILLGVFAFVQKQQKAFAEDIADTVLRDLGAITSGASVAKGTSQGVDIPNSDITLECSDECTCGMTIGAVTAQLKDNIVFGQDNLKGTKLILWAQDWSLPLRVSNFLFVTTPRIKYYMIAAPNSKLLKTFKERIPDNIDMTYIEDPNPNLNTGMIGGNKITNLGYDAVRIVSLSDQIVRPAEMKTCIRDISFKDADVSCVVITPNKVVPGIDNAFNVMLADKEPGEMAYFYAHYVVVGETAALASIFADNWHQFECNMRKAYMRLSFLSLVISERSNELHNQQSTICTGISYPQKSDPTTNPPIPKNWFEKIADTSKALAINEEGAMYQGDITEAGFSRHPPGIQTATRNIIELQKNLKEIETRNLDLLRHDCPLIY